jgi:hypothetical protein
MTGMPSNIDAQLVTTAKSMAVSGQIKAGHIGAMRKMWNLELKGEDEFFADTQDKILSTFWKIITESKGEPNEDAANNQTSAAGNDEDSKTTDERFETIEAAMNEIADLVKEIHSNLCEVKTIVSLAEAELPEPTETPKIVSVIPSKLESALDSISIKMKAIKK